MTIEDALVKLKEKSDWYASEDGLKMIKDKGMNGLDIIRDDCTWLMHGSS